MPRSISADEPTADIKPRRNRRTGRKVLLAAAALVLTAALAAGAYIFSLAGTIDSAGKIDDAFPAETGRPQKPSPVNGKSAVNILVLGSDSRGAPGLDAAKGAASDQRADTLMLVHIPADRKNIYAISLMRDLWVNIPGRGEAKINAALAFGGIPLMVETVESIFGQRIDHVAMIDFEGFKGLTDALGGVDVNVTVPFNASHLANYYFEAGTSTMDGEHALAFVRERYAFAEGDYQRVRNQQSFIKGVVAKTIRADTLSNPLKVKSVVSALSPFISVDRGLDAATVAALGLELKDVRQQNMVMFTLPTRGTGTSADGQSIVLTNPSAIGTLSVALTNDQLAEYVAANKFEKGN